MSTHWKCNVIVPEMLHQVCFPHDDISSFPSFRTYSLYTIFLRQLHQIHQTTLNPQHRNTSHKFSFSSLVPLHSQKGSQLCASHRILPPPINFSAAGPFRFHAHKRSHLLSRICLGVSWRGNSSMTLFCISFS